MKNKEIKHPFYLQIQNDINRIDGKSDKYRALFYGIRIGLIVIASTITITSGWKSSSNGTNVLHALLILGALTTAITAMDTLFQVETKKNIYKLILVELREIRSEIVYFETKGEAELNNRIATYLFPKYQTIMAYTKSLIEKDKESD